MEEQNATESQEVEMQEYQGFEEVHATEIATPNGTILIKHEITLGEMVVSLSIILLLVAFVLKWFISTIWRSR